MGNNDVLDSKFSRRKLLSGTIIGSTAISLTSALTLATPNTTYAIGAGGSSEESLPSGLQFEIHRGNMSAVITEVGGQEFLFTFSQDRMSMFSEGQALIPFPNRIDMGSYVFNGVTEQLPLSEPARYR
jgi:aldose 1-epimerase